MLNSREIGQMIYKSSTVRTAITVLGVMGIYGVAMKGYESILDVQVPTFSKENGRNIVTGPGYRIRESVIDPSIISLMKEPHSLFDSNGLERGKKMLERLCGDTRFSIIYEDPVRSMHVKIPQTEICLANQP